MRFSVQRIGSGLVFISDHTSFQLKTELSKFMSRVFLVSDNLLRCQVDHFHTRLARLGEFCAQYLTKTCMWFMSICHQPNQATQIYVRRKVDVLFVCIFMYMSRIPSQFGFSAVAPQCIVHFNKCAPSDSSWLQLRRGGWTKTWRFHCSLEAL